MADALTLTGHVVAVAKRLQQADERRPELARTLQTLSDGAVVPRVEWRSVEAQARSLLADWRVLLIKDVPEGRQLLRILLDGLIRFTPFEERGSRGFQFAGSASIGALLGGLVLSNGKVRPHRIPHLTLSFKCYGLNFMERRA